MNEPEPVAEAIHADLPFVEDLRRERIDLRDVTPAELLGDFDRNNLGAGPLHVYREVPARRADFEDALAGEGDAAEVPVDAGPQVPQALDRAGTWQVHRMV